MDTKTPYGPAMPARTTPGLIANERSKAQGKAKARYPSKPQPNQPGGGGSTK